MGWAARERARARRVESGRDAAPSPSTVEDEIARLVTLYRRAALVNAWRAVAYHRQVGAAVERMTGRRVRGSDTRTTVYIVNGVDMLPCRRSS